MPAESAAHDSGFSLPYLLVGALLEQIHCAVGQFEFEQCALDFGFELRDDAINVDGLGKSNPGSGQNHHRHADGDRQLAQPGLSLSLTSESIHARFSVTWSGFQISVWVHRTRMTR